MLTCVATVCLQDKVLCLASSTTSHGCHLVPLSTGALGRRGGNGSLPAWSANISKMIIPSHSSWDRSCGAPCDTGFYSDLV